MTPQLLQQQALLVQQAQLNKLQSQQQQQNNLVGVQTNAGQRHVYLISNANTPAYQQRVLQAGGTLPRIHQQHQLQLLQKQMLQQHLQHPQKQVSQDIIVNNSAKTNQPETNAHNKIGASTGTLTANTANQGHPGLSLSGNDLQHMSKVPVAIQLQSSTGAGLKQVICYQSAVPATQMQLTANMSNVVSVNNSTTAASVVQQTNADTISQTLQYKTISMPNVALIKSCPQVITLISSKDGQTLAAPAKLQLISSPKHPGAADLPVSKGGNLSASPSSNNPDLNKDSQGRTAAAPTVNSESNSKSEESSTDGLIFYSMNV